MPSLVKARGLNTFKNPIDFGELGNGTLQKAANVVIDRDGIIEPRRGLGQFGTFGPDISERAKQLLTYKNRLLVHYDNKLAFDSSGDGSFTDFSGDYSETIPGTRMRGIETNGNFYFTTNEGVYKISARDATDLNSGAGYIIKAGGPLALDGTAKLNFVDTPFLPAESTVAYRVAWGYYDSNENLILGEPSSSIVISNPSTSDSSAVDLSFSVPFGVDNEAYFYQIYRTPYVPISNVPQEEYNLVIEENVTSAELTTGIVTITDSTPDDFRKSGSFLYTNPQSGEGITQANAKPPLCSDLTLYKNHVFYANTTTLQRLQINLLSVDSMTSGVSSITVSDGVNPDQTYTFVGTKQETEISFNDFTNTNDGGYFIISSANNERKYILWADKTGSTLEPTGLDTIGTVKVKVNLQAAVTDVDVANLFAIALDDLPDFNVQTSLTNTITVINSNNGPATNAEDSSLSPLNISIGTIVPGTGEDISLKHVLLSGQASVGASIDETARSLVRVINGNPDSTVNAIYMSSVDGLPGIFMLQGKELESLPVSITANDSTTGLEFSPTLPVSGQSVISNNERNPNRIYFSKLYQPEAVPLTNYFDIGPKDKEIKRIIGLRDSLFIFKEDGIYRLTGEAGQFIVTLFDASATILAADSADVLNNQVYMLSTQGITRVSDVGVDVISRDIEDQVKRVINSNFNYKNPTFGVGYEEDRAYILWTVNERNDEVATQAFRFNVFTNTWTTWEVEARCGIVNLFNNKLYLGDASRNLIRQERKNTERQDFADLSFDRTLITDTLNDRTFIISTAQELSVGDMVVQHQYVTISQFNKLLDMLDRDILVDEHDFASTLELFPGQSLSAKMSLLVAKLNANPSLTYTYIFSGTQDPEQIQVEFNTLVDMLNDDPGAFLATYRKSEDSTYFEAPIESIRLSDNTVTTAFPNAFLDGLIVIYQSYQIDVIWNPFIGGDPATFKQFYQGTVMLENSLFRTCEIGYKSDLSQNYEFIPFNGMVNGVWSGYFWSQQNWGGEGNQTPLRTLIPLNKQRCRYLYTRFRHKNAFEKFSVLGIYLNVRQYSDRAYR